jgi:hypothetical protein
VTDSPEKTLCGANKSHGRGTCRNPAGHRTDHLGVGSCSVHGGATPNGKRSAAKAAVRQLIDGGRLRGFLQVDVEQLSDAEVMLEELHRSRQVVLYLESVIASWQQTEPELDEDGWREDVGLPELMEEHLGEMSVSVADSERAAWLAVYRQERAHLLNVAKTVRALGLVEAQQRLDEGRQMLVMLVLRSVLERLGFAGDARLDVVVPEVLLELAS